MTQQCNTPEINQCIDIDYQKKCVPVDAFQYLLDAGVINADNYRIIINRYLETFCNQYDIGKTTQIVKDIDGVKTIFRRTKRFVTVSDAYKFVHKLQFLEMQQHAHHAKSSQIVPHTLERDLGQPHIANGIFNMNDQQLAKTINSFQLLNNQHFTFTAEFCYDVSDKLCEIIKTNYPAVQEQYISVQIIDSITDFQYGFLQIRYNKCTSHLIAFCVLYKRSNDIVCEYECWTFEKLMKSRILPQMTSAMKSIIRLIAE